MAITASIGLFGYYKRNRLIKYLSEDDSRLGVSRNYEFTIYFRKRVNDTRIIKRLRIEVNISMILVFCFFLIMMILATQI